MIDHRLSIALLTGGNDRPYALGMAGALIEQAIYTDFIGSDALDGPLLHGSSYIRFLNLRGDQSTVAPLTRKITRISFYYCRLFLYSFTARPHIFHILWNNKVDFVDRVVLMCCYRAFGRKIVLTAHNVNAAKRDNHDNPWNRLTLRIQYHLCHHILVHTDRMKADLVNDFNVNEKRISVIPFGINDTTPQTHLTRADARSKLKIHPHEKVLLAFGQIAPYKGLEFLIEALGKLRSEGLSIRLIIAGKVKPGHENYWERVTHAITAQRLENDVQLHIQHVPDDEIEYYFKAADAVALSYTAIFQSGVPFLAFNFGLPVIATNVGSLSDDIIENQTGILCRPRDATDLARAIKQYFSSDLYRELDVRRVAIRSYTQERHSWTTVGMILRRVYADLLATVRS